ncbi:sugar phosphate exchanger 2 [Striga asiatica]|uniref:Sugar phosphate exchanger 2 n=1 Tax=Striga asiatica TaxID=4170 RepID=A0A5A7QYD4_STRAF|nr:sugar phosphate exchanger 2 [Striga asiatica]
MLTAAPHRLSPPAAAPPFPRPRRRPFRPGAPPRPDSAAESDRPVRGAFGLDPAFEIVLCVAPYAPTRTEPPDHHGHGPKHQDQRQDPDNGPDRPVGRMGPEKSLNRRENEAFFQLLVEDLSNKLLRMENFEVEKSNVECGEGSNTICQ